VTLQLAFDRSIGSTSLTLNNAGFSSIRQFVAGIFDALRELMGQLHDALRSSPLN